LQLWGKVVKIKSDNGWDNGWIVIETYTRLTKEDVKDNERLYTRHRLTTDI